MTAKKSKWGIGIAVFYSSFILVMLIVVVVSRFNRVDLVAKDYYQQEIEYQQQIERIKTDKSLGNGVKVSYDRADREIVLDFPDNLDYKVIDGNVLFFRPADATLDKTIPIVLDENGFQRVDATTLKTGLWKVQIFWSVDTLECYAEEIIVI